MLWSADLGGVRAGAGAPVRIIAAINLSPESFYKGSVAKTPREALEKAELMASEGADIIDLGAMSTAPYLRTWVSEREEASRLIPAVKLISSHLQIPISVDTHRYGVAKQALEAGADILNDVSGLSDVRLAKLVASEGASLILGARGSVDMGRDPIPQLRRLLSTSLEKAISEGVEEGKVAVDPLIGFFRGGERPWHEWDVEVLRGLYRIKVLGRPVCVGVSRKSFIGAILGLDRPEDRLYGSIAAAAVAVYCGADVVRTHDVRETLHAVRVAEAIRGSLKAVKAGSVECYVLPPLLEGDALELFTRIGCHPVGSTIMSRKARHYILLLKGVSSPVANVLKQEMLAAGGEAAIPAVALVGGRQLHDVVVMGTRSQLERVVEKLKLNAKYAETLSGDFTQLAEAIEKAAELKR
ncbi:MAG: dihydropteroate synthase [Thermoproteota archaeon]|nr:MAG: dihydropteroate synthase [Candidatus Korarchaeota archaeon]